MPVTAFLSRLARALQRDGGFSMVITMGVVSMLLIAAATSMTTVQSDQPLARDDRNKKAAFAAAEAGLQVYVHKLSVDNAYWTRCAVPTDGVNNVYNGGADTRSWRNLSDNTAAYTIEALPANKEAKCDTARPEATMIDAATATFRVRVTGQALNGDRQRTGGKRSLIATFKRKSFLDYIYFTDYEVTDPATYSSFPALNYPTLENPGRNPAGTQRDVVQWGQDACGEYAYIRGENNTLRESQEFYGDRNRNAGRRVNGSWATWSAECSEIRFVSGDSIEGPLHTNDSMLICGSPAFGRKPGDAIETSAPGPTGPTSSWRTDTSCGTAAPEVNFENQSVKYPARGTWRYNQPLLQLPASNRSLSDEAPKEYTFSGETQFELTTGGINVTGRRADGTVLNNTRISYPPDGVIYVQNRTNPSEGPLCSSGYQISNPYGDRSGCGIAKVKGTYNTSLTIGAADDVLILDDVKRASGTPALLGLIANNFIRINHPVADQTRCNNGDPTTNHSSSMSNGVVEAALLTLTHSFIVDNYRCGTSLGTLTVFGAISQKFRGPVGTGSRGSSTTGFLKNYDYDDRLAVRSPPKFLDPVQSSWRIKTFQEQVPAS